MVEMPKIAVNVIYKVYVYVYFVSEGQITKLGDIHCYVLLTVDEKRSL
jgi:hypothetical protein